MHRLLLFIVVAFALLIGVSLAFLKPLVLMSPMEGTLIEASGEPVVGVRLVRRWDWVWTNRQGADETVTDEEGKFQFPRVTGSSVTARLLPHEPNVRQIIVAHSPTGEVEIWRAIKGNYEENSELGGDEFQVLCAIDGLPGPEEERLYASQCVRLSLSSE